MCPCPRRRPHYNAFPLLGLLFISFHRFPERIKRVVFGNSFLIAHEALEAQRSSRGHLPTSSRSCELARKAMYVVLQSGHLSLSIALTLNRKGFECWELRRPPIRNTPGSRGILSLGFGLDKLIQEPLH